MKTKRYCIKGQPSKIEYLDIISETEDGYNIRLTRITDGAEKVKEDFIGRHLFETCLNTGYICELTGFMDEMNAA